MDDQEAKAIEKGKRKAAAQRILDDPVYRDALARAEGEITTALTKAESDDERLEAARKYQALEKVREMLVRSLKHGS